jgi:RsiW-degrading membrane proteinase PrsW (M82 family)
VSTNHSNSAPGSGTPQDQTKGGERERGTPGGQTHEEQTFAGPRLSIDPQQAFREYTTPGQGTPAGPPAYSMPGFYQPGYMGQASAPATPPPASAGMPAYGPYAAYPGQAPVAPGTPVPPGAQPGYPPYGAYPSVQGQAPYYPGYYPYAQPGYPQPGYPMYGGWMLVPEKPRRDTYQLVVSIIAFSCSILLILGGLVSLLLVGLVDFAQSLKATLSDGTYFAGIILFLSFALAGIVGGGFCLYHSIRALFLRKPSALIWLPRFWIFLICYLVVIGAGLWIHAVGLDAHPSALIGLLIYLGGLFPALTIMALGVRRLSFPKRKKGERRVAQWPTTWRRWTLALVSGATLSIGLALILETVLQAIMLGGQSSAVTNAINDPNSNSIPPALYGLVLILFSVIAPLVEEMVKPLAVVVLIGRVKSKAEAFTLGLACGIGFNLVETTGYISSGYKDWLTVALVRSGAGLLHGFGAAMVALAWYILTHKEEGRWQRRVLLTLACAGYAVFQHALWNGSVGLAFLPDPIGSFFQNWSWNLGPLSLDGIELVNIAIMIAILTFFIFMSGRLRARSLPSNEEPPQNKLSLTPAQGVA